MGGASESGGGSAWPAASAMDRPTRSMALRLRNPMTTGIAIVVPRNHRATIRAGSIMGAIMTPLLVSDLPSCWQMTVYRAQKCGSAPGGADAGGYCARCFAAYGRSHGGSKGNRSTESARYGSGATAAGRTQVHGVWRGVRMERGSPEARGRAPRGGTIVLVERGKLRRDQVDVIVLAAEGLGVGSADGNCAASSGGRRIRPCRVARDWRRTRSSR